MTELERGRTYPRLSTPTTAATSTEPAGGGQLESLSGSLFTHPRESLRHCQGLPRISTRCLAGISPWCGMVVVGETDAVRGPSHVSATHRVTAKNGSNGQWEHRLTWHMAAPAKLTVSPSPSCATVLHLCSNQPRDAAGMTNVLWKRLGGLPWARKTGQKCLKIDQDPYIYTSNQTV